MSFVVTRQHCYYSGEVTVEIASGGSDYSGSDALCAKYPGEFETYADPREAVAVAIDICRQWRKDGERRAKVAFGATYGGLCEIEATTFRDAIKRASEVWDKLPKCNGCESPLPDDKFSRWRANDWDGMEYCSDRCATRAVEFEARENARMMAEEFGESEESEE